MNEQQQLFTLLRKHFKSSKDLEYIFTQIKQLNYFAIFIESFMQATTRDQALSIFGKLQVESYKQGNVIFSEREFSNNKIYAIYSGSINLTRSKPLEQLGGHTQIVYEPTPEGYLFRTLQRGDGFGERSVIFGGLRTLTAIATSDCQLLVLEKQYYQQLEKVLFLTFQHQRELIFRVFQKIQGSYSSARIESMIYSFQNCIVKKNEKICVQDEYGQYFYIIDSGELQLSQQNTQNRETIITILSSGAILGEEIVFQNKYSYSAKIISLQAKLLRIHKEDFKIKFPPECRKTISRLIDIHRRDRQELYILANQREENTSPLRIKIKKPMIQQQEQLVIENNDGNCINTNSNNNSNNNNNNNNTKSSGSRKYSLLELQSIMRFDQDSSGFRNMIKVRTSSQYLSSTKGFVASNFSNYSSEYLSSQQQSKLLLNPCEPIKEQLDFGKGEVQEMNKRKQIQLCVMGKDQLNYLTSKNSPKLIKLRNSFMKSFKKHNKSSQNSFSISAPVTPMSSHVSPDSSLLRFKYCQ